MGINFVIGFAMIKKAVNSSAGIFGIAWQQLAGNV